MYGSFPDSHTTRERRIVLDKKKELRLLLVEDSADDAELLSFALRNAPFTFRLERVETPDEFVAALDKVDPDVILCDFHLPRFSMAEALRIVRSDRKLDIPFIVVSRLIGEDAAVQAMRDGADDYLLKGRLGRLVPAIVGCLEKRDARRNLDAAEAALRRTDLVNRSLLRSTATALAVLDGAGRILVANAAWERRLGPASPERSADTGPGGNFLAHLATTGREGDAVARELQEGIEAVMQRRTPGFAHEYSLPGRGGTRWEMLRAEPLDDSEHGAVVSVEDITPRMLAKVALHDANSRLHLLSRRILAVQEEERRAIALELHDDIGQSLAALKIGLHGIAAEAPEELAVRTAHCLAITEDTLDKLRRLSYSLRPPQLDQFGLEGALHWLAEQQGRATGISIQCRVNGLDRRPHATVEAACYRIVQEALNNAVRHGQAREVLVELKLQERLLNLAVRDDGQGFDAEDARARAARSGSLGLLGMAERAELAGGSLKVRSVRGAGTTVSAIFPLEGPGRAGPEPA